MRGGTQARMNGGLSDGAGGIRDRRVGRSRWTAARATVSNRPFERVSALPRSVRHDFLLALSAAPHLQHRTNAILSACR